MTSTAPTTPVAATTTDSEEDFRKVDKEATAGLHIVYDSQRSDLVPYPEGEVLRTPSPEHTGIPARMMKMPPMRRVMMTSHEGYTSDESVGNQSRKLPPALRRKSKNGAVNNNKY